MQNTTLTLDAYPCMIVQYDWILDNIEQEPQMIASKMILFRGERVFRVALKNQVKSPVLYFVVADLNKIGLGVNEVKFGIQDSDKSQATFMSMSEKTFFNFNVDLQLFTIDLKQMVTGKQTFLFRIHVTGNFSGYSYQLSDRLLKDQLWAVATEKSHSLVDVELVVKDQTFSAHKAILAARSQVFAAEFTSQQQVGEGPYQIQMDDVEPSTVEHFLHFIYTGESMGKLANEELLKLAEKYQLTTLISLCRVAIKNLQLNKEMVMNFRKIFNNETEILNSKIWPDKDTEIFFDRSTTTFHFFLGLNLFGNESPVCVMQSYQNEDMLFLYLNGIKEIGSKPKKIPQPILHCSCAKHGSFGLQVEDIIFRGYFEGYKKEKWLKMKPQKEKGEADLLHFAEKVPLRATAFNFRELFHFDIKTVSTIGNYYYEMMDNSRMKHFWGAATKNELTDVEIFVGTVKLMEGHRVILSARSQFLKESWSKISDRPTGKITLTLSAEFDVTIVTLFLKFLYTGLLDTSCSLGPTEETTTLNKGLRNLMSNDYKQLLQLATMYEIETLKNLCRPAVSPANLVSEDVEGFTNYLLGL